MRIGVPKEIHEGERRCATTPEVAEQLQKLGYTVSVEAGAGALAGFPDAAFREAGCEIVEGARKLWAEVDIVLKVRAPETHPELCIDEVELLRPGMTLISFIWPAQNKALLDRLAARQASVIAMDSVPRISRAQKLDALSSMANIAGYRAVVEAAQHFGRFFTGQVTAAGKVQPAKVLVIGAGVAGLAAIGAAKSMGAIVRAYDTRPEVKEQVKSMDAEFLEVHLKEEVGSTAGGYAKEMSAEQAKAVMDLYARQAMEVDIIITTALIPGKPAPRLITEGMVESMREGSVIVDLAAEQGGNCACTEPGRVVVKHGVSIVGYTDLPSRLATQASQLYGTNLRHFLTDLTPAKDGQINVNMEDDVIRGATVVKEGTITWPPPPLAVSAAPAAQPAAVAHAPKVEKGLLDFLPPQWRFTVPLGIAILAFWWVGAHAPAAFMSHFTVFVLSCFIGYQVIWNVTPALHTPLMSVTNAISSIIVIGALVEISAPGLFIKIFAGIAILFASINTFGGFMVTQRMLKMFQR
jgi:NAD(P) transhydrogenase subunit alpha